MKLLPHWNMVTGTTWACALVPWSLIFGCRINHLRSESCFLVDVCNISATLMKRKSWRYIVETSIKAWGYYGFASHRAIGSCCSRNKQTFFQYVTADTNLQLSLQSFASYTYPSLVTGKFAKRVAPTPLIFSWRLSVTVSQTEPRKGAYYLPHVVLNSRKFKEAVL